MIKVSSFTNNVIKKAFSQKGFLLAEILSQWSKIIGENLCSKCIPKKISFSQLNQKENSTLCILVKDKYTSLNIEYSKNILIERINTYFGKLVIKKIHIFTS